jgi:hypothetical protein
MDCECGSPNIKRSYNVVLGKFYIDGPTNPFLLRKTDDYCGPGGAWFVEKDNIFYRMKKFIKKLFKRQDYSEDS